MPSRLCRNSCNEPSRLPLRQNAARPFSTPMQMPWSLRSVQKCLREFFRAASSFRSDCSQRSSFYTPLVVTESILSRPLFFCPGGMRSVASSLSVDLAATPQLPDQPHYSVFLVAALVVVLGGQAPPVVVQL